MLGINKRPSFSLKNIYLYNLWYLAILKTLNTHRGVILTLSFPKNVIFLEKLLFKLYSVSLPIEMVYFKWKLTLSKTPEYLLISWATQRSLSFVPLVWSCFWHVLASSSFLWLVTGCSTFYKRRSHRNQLLQRSANVIISGTAFLN